MSFSKVIVVGNLGKDPELRYMPDGRPVASFSVCANERRRNGNGEAIETQSWFTANVYGNSAEAVSQHLQKGDQVYIEGRLKPELWRRRNPPDHEHQHQRRPVPRKATSQRRCGGSGSR